MPFGIKAFGIMFIGCILGLMSFNRERERAREGGREAGREELFLRPPVILHRSVLVII